MNSQNVEKNIMDSNLDQTDLNFKVNFENQSAVTTIRCTPHPQTCMTLEEAKTQFQTNGYIKCTQCSGVANSPNELVKSIHWMVKEQFYSSTSTISIIQGMLVCKYTRQKRYLQCLNENTSLIKDLIGRSKINKELQIINILTSCPGRKYIPINCGLDKVRMNIPVRIIKCETHIECYELTSLLVYVKENSQDFKQPAKFQCEYCQYEYEWKDYASLLSVLIIDMELLKFINQSVPFSQQLIYDSKLNKLRDCSQQSDGKIVDQQISAYYQLSKPKINFEIFQQSVINSASIASNGASVDKIIKQIKEKLDFEKFQIFSINLKDQLTQKVIEYPARCINCTDFTKCLDLRSFISDLEINKQSGQQQYKCRLCNKEFRSLTLSSNVIYIDHNIQSQLYALYGQHNLQEISEYNFQYDGKQTLLKEFKKNQKYTYTEYLKVYNQENNLPQDNTVVKFNIFVCAQTQQQIKIPLIIKACSKIFEFEAFYKWFKVKNFDITAILDICKCEKCILSQSKSVFESVYYYEALGIALEAYGNKTSKGFSFDFKTKTIQGYDLTKSQIIKQQETMLQKVPAQQGFYNLLSDELYQQFFTVKTIKGADNTEYYFKVESMQQEFGGVTIQYDQQDIKKDFVNNMVEMNKQIEQNEDLKKWNFKIENIDFQINGDLFKVSKQEGDPKIYEM